MLNDIDLVARLSAWSRKRAVPTATARTVSVQPHAMILCPLSMAGGDQFVHAVAIGQNGCEPEIFSIPDPRYWPDQKKLYAWFSAKIDRYFTECEHNQVHPQLWVASDSVAEHLDILSESLRFSKDSNMKRLGECLGYCSERYFVTGQQSLHTAARVLRTHWATGQASEEDHHLGVLLTWIEPPQEKDFDDALQEAESVVMGIRTDSDMDRILLNPMVERYHNARKLNDRMTMLEAENAIQDALTEVLLPIYQAVQRSLDLLVSKMAPSNILDDLTTVENDEFAWWCQGREAGYSMPIADSVTTRVYNITAREFALENFNKAIVYHDVLALERAILTGSIVRATITERCTVKKGRTNTSEYTLVSTQDVLRLRVRDRLTWMKDNRAVLTVKSIVRRDGQTHIRVLQTEGMKAVGEIAIGTELVLGSELPSWDLGGKRKQFKARLGLNPWTHTNDPPPLSSKCSGSSGEDLLASLEAFR